MLMTVDQAARYAQVSTEAVNRWIRQGRFPVIEPEGPGHLVRIHDDDYADFLARARSNSARRTLTRRAVEHVSSRPARKRTLQT
jgi:excisionase family DNA binding protein